MIHGLRTGHGSPERKSQEARGHSGWDHKLQEVDDILAIEYGEAEKGRPSAMALWEVCLALVQGVVELPAIEEGQNLDKNEGDFYTVEGWKVRDPQRGIDMATAASRAKLLGIVGLAGVGTSPPESRFTSTRPPTPPNGTPPNTPLPGTGLSEGWA